MNVTSTSTGDLNAVLTVNISQDDYQAKVNKVLGDYRKNAKIPGFRPGKIPMGMIKKQYGKAVLIDEVNHILQHAIGDYIREQKLDILGNPIPVAQDDIDWDTQTDFAFDFEIGLAPEIDLKLNDKTKVPYYKIVADKKMLDRYVDDYAKRFGKMSTPKTVEESCILKVSLKECTKDGSIVAEGVESNGTFGTEIVADKKTSKALMGMKVGDNLVIDINKAFEKDFNAANAFGLTEDQIKNSTGLFDFTVNEISKVEAAEINQELFDKVFGEGEIANEKEFRARIKTEAEQMFVGESDRQFLNDIRKVVLEKSKFDLPNEFLKKWMLTSPEREVTAEQVEKEYPEMKDSMKWQLVENKIVKDEKIEVTQEELIDYTKQLVVRQMMQYGQQPPADQLENIAKSVLENKEEGQRVTDQLFSEKLLAYYKNTFKLQEKETTFDDFVKLINK